MKKKYKDLGEDNVNACFLHHDNCPDHPCLDDVTADDLIRFWDEGASK